MKLLKGLKKIFDKFFYLRQMRTTTVAKHTPAATLNILWVSWCALTFASFLHHVLATDICCHLHENAGCDMCSINGTMTKHAEVPEHTDGVPCLTSPRARGRMLYTLMYDRLLDKSPGQVVCSQFDEDPENYGLCFVFATEAYREAVPQRRKM